MNPPAPALTTSRVEMTSNRRRCRPADPVSMIEGAGNCFERVGRGASNGMIQ